MAAILSIIFLGVGCGVLIATRSFDETYFYLSALFMIATCIANPKKKE